MRQRFDFLKNIQISIPSFEERVEELKEKHGAYFQIGAKVYFYSLTEAKNFMDGSKTMGITKTSWPVLVSAFTAYMYTVDVTE